LSTDEQLEARCGLVFIPDDAFNAARKTIKLFSHFSLACLTGFIGFTYATLA